MREITLDFTVIASLVLGAAVGGFVGSLVAMKIAKRESEATTNLPPIDPKSIAAVVASEIESSLNDVRESIGSIGEKIASIEETVSSLYQLFAAYLGAAAAYRGTRRRRVSQAQAQQTTPQQASRAGEKSGGGSGQGG